jgi:hypothetical protein
MAEAVRQWVPSLRVGEHSQAHGHSRSITSSACELFTPSSCRILRCGQNPGNQRWAGGRSAGSVHSQSDVTWSTQLYQAVWCTWCRAIRRVNLVPPIHWWQILLNNNIQPADLRIACSELHSERPSTSTPMSVRSISTGTTSSGTPAKRVMEWDSASGCRGAVRPPRAPCRARAPRGRGHWGAGCRHRSWPAAGWPVPSVPSVPSARCRLSSTRRPS